MNKCICGCGQELMPKDYYEQVFPPYSNHVVAYLFRGYITMNESIRFISKGQMVSQ